MAGNSFVAIPIIMVVSPIRAVAWITFLFTKYLIYSEHPHHASYPCYAVLL